MLKLRRIKTGTTFATAAVVTTRSAFRRPPRLLDRGGNSHRRSSSRSSSADAAAVEPKPKRLRGGGGEDHDLAETSRYRDEADTFSLPPIGAGGGEGWQRRRKQPRHVSTFRERILEERRARKEVRKKRKSRYPLNYRKTHLTLVPYSCPQTRG